MFFGSKMDLEIGSFTRCGRHPSQFFTGFCSSCLAEKLANVDSVEKTPKPFSVNRHKQVERSVAIPDLHRKSCDTRVRKTLLSLFQLDDDFNNDKASTKCSMTENSINGITFAECRNGYAGMAVPISSAIRISNDKNVSQTDWVSQSRKDPEINGDEMDTQVSSLDHNADNAFMWKHAAVDNESLKERGVSYWFGSVFSRRILRRSTDMRSADNRNVIEEKIHSGDFSEEQLEAKPNFRHSCDRKVSCDPHKAFWEQPRHSWDGVMMGKPLAPSFTSNGEDRNSSIFHSRRSLPEDAMLVASRPSTDKKDMNKPSIASSSEERPIFAYGRTNGETHDEATYQDVTVPKIRRRCHGWSKVWNKTITSPFRVLMHKHQNVSERSLSKSCQEVHEEKNMDCMETDVGLSFHGSSMNPARRTQSSNRNKNISNGENHRFKPEIQKKEFVFSRSRSVHYSSSGNLDSGLLRFYLTPLRSSRRTPRRRTSRSFAWGILGF